MSFPIDFKQVAISFKQFASEYDFTKHYENCTITIRYFDGVTEQVPYDTMIDFNNIDIDSISIIEKGYSGTHIIPSVLNITHEPVCNLNNQIRAGISYAHYLQGVVEIKCVSKIFYTQHPCYYEKTGKFKHIERIMAMYSQPC